MLLGDGLSLFRSRSGFFLLSLASPTHDFSSRSAHFLSSITVEVCRFLVLIETFFFLIGTGFASRFKLLTL